MSSGRTTVVMSHLEPNYGIERAGAELVRHLSELLPLDVVVLGGPAPAVLGSAPVTRVGARLTGLGRLAQLPRLRRLGAAGGSVILAGAWVAVPWLLANLGSARPARVVIWEHSFTRERVRTGLAMRVLWAAARILYGRADLVVAPGTPTADLVRDSIGCPVTTIPNVTSVVLAAGPPTARRGILVVGRLEPVKRVDLALRAIAAAAGGAHVVVVGDGSERTSLERLALELGIADRVTFLGAVDRAEVLAQMRAAQVLLHPASGETFGMVYLEAAQCRLPVVTTGHTVSRELVPTLVPGLVAEPGDLAAAINAALDSPHNGWEWSAADRRREETFAVEVVVNRWVDVLGGRL